MGPGGDHVRKFDITNYKPRYPHSFSDGTWVDYERWKRGIVTVSNVMKWTPEQECAELWYCLKGKAASRLNTLEWHEIDDIEAIWEKLDKAYLPANYERAAQDEFLGCRKKVSESMKTFFLNLQELYMDAHKTAGPEQVRSSVREQMLSNLSENELEVCRPYFHMNDPEEIATCYDAVVMQLKRSQGTLRRNAEMVLTSVQSSQESASKAGDTKQEAGTQAALDLNTVNVNVVQPNSDGNGGGHMHMQLCGKNLSDPQKTKVIPYIITRPAGGTTSAGQRGYDGDGLLVNNVESASNGYIVAPQEGPALYQVTASGQKVYEGSNAMVIPAGGVATTPPQEFATQGYQVSPNTSYLNPNAPSFPGVGQTYPLNPMAQQPNPPSPASPQQDQANPNQQYQPYNNYQGTGNGGYQNGYRNQSYNRGPYNQRPKPDHSNKTCWNCHEVGHIKRNCPELKKGKPADVQKNNASMVNTIFQKVEKSQGKMKSDLKEFISDTLKGTGLAQTKGN